MTEQFSPLAMLCSVTHAEDPQRLDTEAIVYWRFHKGGLLAVKLFDHLGVRVRDFPRSDAHRWSIFLMETVYCRGAIPSQVKEHQPFWGDLCNGWTWDGTQR